MRRSFALVALVALLLGGCLDRAIAGQTIALVARTTPAIEADDDPDLVEAAAPAGLLQLEGFYVAYGGDRRLLPLLAQATCGLGAGFVQDHWEEATLAGRAEDARALAADGRTLLGRCATLALEWLGPRFAGVLDVDDARAAAMLRGAGRGDAAMLYWLGTAVAASIGIDAADQRLTALLPRATAILERAVALDDGLDHGSGHVVLGIIYASRSAAIGGDPARGKAHLERALALTGGKLLLAKVMLARFYAVNTRDQALFERTIREVLNTPPSVWPEQRLSGELAHRKARRYWKYRKRFF
ncbi:MAG: TRAP transporter TatT component family protein [Deltaproteobacteria bacterium]|nr:TRAP transporter TatT component family protein [Deltaproteobacteria bacterium]